MSGGLVLLFIYEKQLPDVSLSTNLIFTSLCVVEASLSLFTNMDNKIPEYMGHCEELDSIKSISGNEGNGVRSSLSLSFALPMQAV